MTADEIDKACNECEQECYRCTARDECDMCPMDYEEMLNSLDEW